MIETYRKAEIAVLTGKSYKIGTRELVREDYLKLEKEEPSGRANLTN